jgi:CHRD domain
MYIDRISRQAWLPLGAALIFAIFAFGSYSGIAAAADIKVTLAGDQEVPPVKSAGTGTGTISVGADKSVGGSVTTTGIAGTAAHVHEAAAGTNGPVIIPLTKNGDTYAVAAGAKLTDAQFASFQAGKLYVNVHTAANPGGELRGQLKP